MKKGLIFSREDVAKVVADVAPWIQLKADDKYLVVDVPEFPKGTSLTAKINGIKTDYEDETVEVKFSLLEGNEDGKLISDEFISLPAFKTTSSVNVNFAPYIIYGIYGEVDGETLDILTDEEIAFEKLVSDALGTRDDSFAIGFKKLFRKQFGDKEEVLLHEIKKAIIKEEILRFNDITPETMVLSMINLTAEDLRIAEKIDKIMISADAEKDEKKKKSIEHEAHVMNDYLEYLDSIIAAVVNPLLQDAAE